MRGWILLAVIGLGAEVVFGADNKKPGYPAAVDHSRSAGARKGGVDARAAEKKGEEQMQSVVRGLRQRFEENPEWVAAKKEAAEAQGQFEAARATVVKGLEGNKEYLAAREKKAHAESERDSGNAEPGSDARTAAATAVLTAGAEVSRQENGAIGADATASAARQRLSAAAAKVAGLQKQFDDSIKSDPQWVAGRKMVDDNEALARKADADLSAAMRAEDQAERDRAAKIADMDRQKQIEDQKRREEERRRQDEEQRRRAEDRRREDERLRREREQRQQQQK